MANDPHAPRFSMDLYTLRDGILGTVARTPLIRLKRLLDEARFQLFAKLEMFNPGGSIKDRAALSILTGALRNRMINSATVVIESSSGNLGIGLAQACNYLGLRFICVVDSRTTRQNIAILKSYGAEVDVVTEPDPDNGDLLSARLKRVQWLLASIPNSFWCNQYANTDNARAHHQTMDEIVTALDGRLDYLFCATSSCGTLRGCSEYVRSKGLRTRIIAVDAEGSVIFGKQAGARLIPGHGAGRVPELYQCGLESEHVHVSDLDCVVGCRRLLARESILAGGSSGGVIAAIQKKAWDIPDEAVCAVILCDRGERYLDTIYSDAWVEGLMGDVAHLWQRPPVREPSPAAGMA